MRRSNRIGRHIAPFYVVPGFRTIAFSLMLGSLSPSIAAAQATSQEAAADDSTLEPLVDRLNRIEQLTGSQLVEERRARQAAEAARKRADEAQRKAERLALAAKAKSRDDDLARRTAEAAAETARADAAASAAEADDLQQVASEQLAQSDRLRASAQALQTGLAAERRRRWIAIAGSGAILAAVVLVAWLLSRRLRRRSRAELNALKAARPEPVEDCMLLGRDRNLHLPGRQLPKSAGGVIVGRNPEEVDAVIGPQDVSRRHAKFFHDGRSFHVEDLGSRFGTALNGSPLAAHAPMSLGSGDKVAFADHEFEFRVLARGHDA